MKAITAYQEVKQKITRDIVNGRYFIGQALPAEKEFAKEFNSSLIFDCDVGSDEQITALFKDLAKSWPQFDGMVHSIGFAPRDELGKRLHALRHCRADIVGQHRLRRRRNWGEIAQ